jgi:tryptophanyl-tRNA synthetase
VIDAVIAEFKPIRERARDYTEDPSAVQAIIDEGCEAARDVARDTLDEVRKVMCLSR